MDSNDLSRIASLLLLFILGYLSYLVLRPFLSYLLLSVVLVILFRPVYRWLLRRTNRKWLSSLIMVVSLILLLVLPSILIGYALVREAPAAFESFVTRIDISPVEGFIEQVTGYDVQPDRWVRDSIARFRSFVLQNAAGFLTSVTAVLIGLFTMFFVMYYLFVEGDTLLESAKNLLPMRPQQRDALLKEVDAVVHGIIEGQLVLGVVQGALGGLVFWILGLPNPLFWGFVMVILSVIPFVGAFVVWVPAALWLLLTGEVVRGIILIAIGAAIISQVDNVLRPFIVSRRADIHPVVVLVGVLGGLRIFGVIGFLVGPLILALLLTMLRFYGQRAK